MVPHLEETSGFGDEIAKAVVVPAHRALARGRRGVHESAKLRFFQAHPRAFQPCGLGNEHSH